MNTKNYYTWKILLTIIVFLSFVIGMNFISATMSVSWNYQENANHTTHSSGWIDFSKTTDGNWNTYSLSSSTSIFESYYFPLVGYTTNSLWQVKGDEGEVNLTIDTSCYSNPNVIVFRVNSNVGTNTTSWYCEGNGGGGASVKLLQQTGADVYEEGIWWNIPVFVDDKPTFNVNINPLNGDTITTNPVDIYVQVFDDLFIQNVTLIFDGQVNNTLISGTDFVDGTTTLDFDTYLNVTNGTHTWEVIAYDNSSQMSDTGQFTFTANLPVQQQPQTQPKGVLNRLFKFDKLQNQTSITGNTINGTQHFSLSLWFSNLFHNIVNWFKGVFHIK